MQTVCPVCLAGDQRLRPGSIASGVFCGCGNRLIPEKATASAVPQPSLMAQASVALQHSQDANTNLAVMLRGMRMENDRLKATLEEITKERDTLKAEIASIQAALSIAGLPQAPPIIQIPPAPALPQVPVDFHGVPLTTTGTPQLAGPVAPITGEAK